MKVTPYKNIYHQIYPSSQTGGYWAGASPEELRASGWKPNSSYFD